MGHLGKNATIVLALVAAGFLAAWLRFRPHLGTEGRYTDGVEIYDVTSADEVRYAVWDRPQVMTGSVNTAESERRPAISPDGRYLVFVVGERGLGSDLYIADLVDGDPVDPRPLSIVNSEADEWAPCFSGGALYLATDRFGTAGGLDLWRATYDLGTFGEPERLNGGLNTTADDTDPAPVPGTDAIVFSSNRRAAPTSRIESYDLYIARPRRAVTAETEEDSKSSWQVDPLENLNTNFDERDPAFTTDGKTLFFASDREGTVGGFDLYRSALGADGWVDPEPLVGVNSVASERGPLPSRDGFEILFGVEGGAEVADPDLYRARSLELFRTPGKPIGWREMLVLLVLLFIALLAWLAKKWEQLEILYKCVLVSLVAHLLLMWYFRDVYPESGEYELKGASDRVRVRLVSNPSGALARNAERGGALEAARSAAAAAVSAPERHAEATRAIESAARAAEAQLERATAAAVAAPSRESGSTPERVEAARPEVALDARSEVFERLAGGAPTLAVEAASKAAPGERAEAGTPTRAAARRASEATPSPEAWAQSRAVAGAELPSAPGARTVELSPTVESDSPSTEVARPQETLERIAGTAPELAIEAGFVDVPVERGEVDAARAESRAPDVLQGREAAVSEAAPLELRGEPADAGDDPLAGRAVAEVERQTMTAPSTELEQRIDDFERLSADARVDDDLLAEAPQSIARPDVPRDETLEASRADAPTITSDEALVPSSYTALELPDREPEAFEAPTWTSGLADRVPLEPEALERPTTALADRPTEDFERLYATAAEEDALEPAPSSTSRPDERRDEGLELARADAPTTEEEEALLAPSSHAALERPDREPEPLDEPDFASALADVSPLERPSREVELETKFEPSRTGESPDPSEEEHRVAEFESGVERDFADSLLAVSASAVADRAQRDDAPDRWQRESRDESELAPTFRPLATVEAPVSSDDRVAEVERWEHTPYQSRTGIEKARAIELHGGSVETEAAVAAGLEYLERRQKRGGYWGRAREEHDKYGLVAVGKTGLAMLAFMGAGHTQESGTEYSRVVDSAIRYLLSVQDDDTGHFGYSTSYSHAIATYALAECYALTEDERLRRPLERAVAHIVSHQNLRDDRRFYGGWGYYYPDGRTYDPWPRASVTSWQVMALESARLGGLEVDDDVFTAARTFLVRCWDGGHRAFRYSHDRNRLDSDYPILPGSTPATLFALSLLGEDVAGRDYGVARAFVLDRKPDRYRYTGDDDFVFRARGNLYFWYYSTLAMFRIGGQPWDEWNEAMKSTLLEGQDDDGSWDDISVYADYADDSDEDRVYSTAMCVLTLEVYYRYFTPLLKVD